ncbi:MAG: hypothetical protein ACREQ5_18315, partial [Candidatus Dormibacteria bacterium]
MRRRVPRPGGYRGVIFDLDGTLTREANSWAAVQRKLGPGGIERQRDRWARYREGSLDRTAFLVEQVADLRGRAAALLDEVVAEVEYHDGVAAACAELRSIARLHLMHRVVGEQLSTRACAVERDESALREL